MLSTLPRAACAGILISLALTAAGCGGDEDNPPAAGSIEDDPGTGSPSTQPLTAEQLKSALIGAADLPAGFKDETAQADAADRPRFLSGDPACKEMVTLSDNLDLGKAEGKAAFAYASLTKAQSVNVEQTLTSYPAGKAEQAYAAITEAAAGCKSFVLDMGGGAQGKFRQITAPSGSYGGDVSQVTRFTGSVEGTPFTTDQVLARAGDTLVSLDVSALSPTLVAGFAQEASQKAVAKLDQAGS